MMESGRIESLQARYRQTTRVFQRGNTHCCTEVGRDAIWATDGQIQETREPFLSFHGPAETSGHQCWVARGIKCAHFTIFLRWMVAIEKSEPGRALHPWMAGSPAAGKARYGPQLPTLSQYTAHHTNLFPFLNIKIHSVQPCLPA